VKSTVVSEGVNAHVAQFGAFYNFESKFKILTLENIGLDTNFIKIGPSEQKL